MFKWVEEEAIEMLLCSGARTGEPGVLTRTREGSGETPISLKGLMKKRERNFLHRQLLMGQEGMVLN